MPCLYPKLVRRTPTRSSLSSASLTSRSRSSRPVRSLVSITASAASRVALNRARSAAIASATERGASTAPPSGWRCRVSLNLRISTSSRASKKIIRAVTPIEAAPLRTDSIVWLGSPSRASRTRQTRAKRSGSCPIFSTSAGRSSNGRLSIVRKPISSSDFVAVVFPAPESPVSRMMRRSRLTSRPPSPE